MSQVEARRNTVRFGQFFGVPVYLSWSWFVGSVVIALVFTPVIQQRMPELGGSALLVATGFALLLGLSVLIHELAHSLTALRFGHSVRQITLFLLGGVSEIEGEQRRPWLDFTIAAVGPLASLVLAAIGFALLGVLPAGGVIHLLAWQLTVANLLVGIFNFLPGLPLDGGRMLRDVIWALTGRENTGTFVAAWAGRVLAVAVVGLSLLPLLWGRRDLLALVWGLWLASFIWIESDRALQTARVRAVLPALAVRTMARRAVPVPQDLAVSEGLRRLAAVPAGVIVTVDHDGHPVGVVHETSVAALPEIRRPWVDLSAVTRATSPETTISATVDGESLVNHLAEHPAPEYVVVEADGTIYGVLARDDVARMIDRLVARR